MGCGGLKTQVPAPHARPAKSESPRLVLGLTFSSSSLGDSILHLWLDAVIFLVRFPVFQILTVKSENHLVAQVGVGLQIPEHQSHKMPVMASAQ